MADVYVHATCVPMLPLTPELVGFLRMSSNELDLLREYRLSPDEAVVEALPPASAVELLDEYEQTSPFPYPEHGCGLSIDRVADGIYYLYWQYGLDDGVCEVLQFVLRKLPDTVPYLAIEGSTTCGKVRPGAFGGFAVFITRTQIFSVSTSAWLREREMEAEAGNGG